MAFFTEVEVALNALRTVLGDAVAAVDVPSAARQLSDDALVSLIEHATVLVRAGESVRIAATGAVAARSTREAGHGGLAQKRGHRSAVSLIQDLTGTTHADAARQVPLGEALAAVADPVPEGGLPVERTLVMEDARDASPAPAAPCQRRPWHAVLGDALLTGALTSAQHDAIYRGLGEPPILSVGATADGSGGVGDAVGEDVGDADGGDPAREAGACSEPEAGGSEPEASGFEPEAGGSESATDADFTAAWEAAAAQLIDEAAVRTVEELRSAARTVRDLLDPVGAARRFDERFQARSFRRWTDRDGIRHGSFQFDDEGDAWIEAIIATALRPRRGGPRFVDPAEKARADELIADPRTNDQLAYDLLFDILRAGALAETATVFGTRQAGIRIVTTAAAHSDAVAGRPAVAILEDTGTSLPGWLAARHTCDTGAVTAIHDDHGHPLDLGREARLYSAKQRVALAIRDGGCRVPGCDRPASYCEAHHIDPFAQGGRTDIARGILLCRFHHMNLHHHGWRITRQGRDDFVLHVPGRTPVALRPRLVRRYAFADLQPPPRRFHPA